MGILLIQGLVEKWKCCKEKRAENKESLSCDNSVLEREGERQGANQQWRREENLERFHSIFSFSDTFSMIYSLLFAENANYVYFFTQKLLER